MKGIYREEHLFALKQAVGLYECYMELTGECEVMINRQLKKLTESPDVVPLSEKGGSNHNGSDNQGKSTQELMSQLYGGVELTQIEGIGEKTVLTILSEIGIDMSRWLTVKHFV